MDFKCIKLSRLSGVVVLSLMLLGMAASPPLVGGPAPPFALKNTIGETVQLAELRERLLILNFWATWCAPCTKEMPELQKTHEAYADKVQVVAINLAESEEKVRRFVMDHRLSFPVLLDSRGDVSQDYEILNLPVTYIITPDGIVREKIFGGGITQEMIQAKLRRWSGMSAPETG